MGGSWGISNTDCEPGKSKYLAKGNLEEILHKSNPNCYKGVTQGLSLNLPVCLSTHTVLFVLLINTSLVSLLFVFVGILFLQSRRARALSLTTGLTARIWCSHFWELTSISGWGTEALLQKGTAGQGRLRPGECMELAATCSWDLILETANQRFREREKELASKYFALLNFSFEKWRFPNQDSELENKISHRIKKQYGGNKKISCFEK